LILKDAGLSPRDDNLTFPASAPAESPHLDKLLPSQPEFQQRTKDTLSSFKQVLQNEQYTITNSIWGI